MGHPISGPQDAPQAVLSRFYARDSWIDGRAEEQLKHVAGWPGMQAVAGFPDLHPGLFGPVGAAFLADRIWPQLVGPDIGCGMALWRLDLPRHRLKLDKAIRRLAVLDDPADEVAARLALSQAGLPPDMAPWALGSIGGGNHFCEVQVVASVADPQRSPLRPGDLCLLVHSGSRSHGAQVFAGLDDSWRLGYATDSPAAQHYLALHEKAVRWARLNRAQIAARAAEALSCQAHRLCDTLHNHVVPHQGHWLHRKGAAMADGGMVPLAGSRDAPSFLLAIPDQVPAALASVSHGAGRRYDRASMQGRMRKAKADLAQLTHNRFGGRVVCNDRDLLREEAGSAYKNPETVVADLVQFGLAQVLARLEPLITFKTSGKNIPAKEPK